MRTKKFHSAFKIEEFFLNLVSWDVSVSLALLRIWLEILFEREEEISDRESVEIYQNFDWEGKLLKTFIKCIIFPCSRLCCPHQAYCYCKQIIFFFQRKLQKLFKLSPFPLLWFCICLKDSIYNWKQET